MHFSRVILVLGAMLIFAVSQKKKSNCECHPCARTMLISFKPVISFLKLCASSLSRGHAIKKKNTRLRCILSIEEKLECTASVSNLTNATGGLSG